MLLAVDVGNTQTVLGLFAEATLAGHWRISTNASLTADELRVKVAGLLGLDGLSWSDVEPRHPRVGRAAADRRVGGPRRSRVRVRRHGRRSGPQDRHAHPLRQPARGGRRPHRQRRRGLRALRRAGHRRRLRHRDHHRRRSTRTAPTWAERSLRASRRRRGALLEGRAALQGRPRAAERRHRHEHARERAGRAASRRGGDGRRARAPRRGSSWAPRRRSIATGGLAERMALLCETISDVDMDLTLEGLRMIFERNR